MSGDRIALTGLSVRGHHGVLASERRDGQDFVVDVVLHLDLREAGRTDDVGDTVHYGELAEQLAAVVAGEPVDLLETLAGRLAAVCLVPARVERVEVTVHKPQAPIEVSFADVSVTVHRPVTAVVSIGSNVGDRLAYLRLAVEELEPVAVSPVYETEPVGGITQPDFLNAVLLCEADATQVWQRAQRAERRAARERVVRWGPRTLDVDVVTADPPVPAELLLPHPRAAWRSFVLVPWLDLEPGAVLAGHGSVAELVAGLGRHGLRRTEDALR